MEGSALSYCPQTFVDVIVIEKVVQESDEWPLIPVHSGTRNNWDVVVFLSIPVVWVDIEMRCCCDNVDLEAVVVAVTAAVG